MKDHEVFLKKTKNHIIIQTVHTVCIKTVTALVVMAFPFLLSATENILPSTKAHYN